MLAFSHMVKEDRRGAPPPHRSDVLTFVAPVAERAVVSMLNQMLRLAQAAQWWDARADAVIIETVEFASGDFAVAGAAAQRAWDTYWRAHCSLGSSFGPFGPDSGGPEEADLAALHQQMNTAETDWRAAWDRWHNVED